MSNLLPRFRRSQLERQQRDDHHLLPHFRRSQVERQHRDDHLGAILTDSTAVEQVVRQAVDTKENAKTVARATLAGDKRRLRGFPICAYGVQGVSPGTDPLAAVIRKLG